MYLNSTTLFRGFIGTQFLLCGLLLNATSGCRIASGPKVQAELTTSSAQSAKTELSVAIESGKNRRKLDTWKVSVICGSGFSEEISKQDAKFRGPPQSDSCFFKLLSFAIAKKTYARRSENDDWDREGIPAEFQGKNRLLQVEPEHIPRKINRTGGKTRLLYVMTPLGQKSP